VNHFISQIIKRDISVEFTKLSVLAAFFGALIHLFLDYLTARGIPLFFPFSLTKYSAELYQNIDLITLILAVVVILIIYLKTRPEYKKIAMAVFIIVLVSFGGMRALEKYEVLTTESSYLDENYSKITVYPTNDVFNWQVVKSNPQNTSYLVYNYKTLTNDRYNLKNYINPSIVNGSYESGLMAINIADSDPMVKRFKWNSQYSLVNATHGINGWNITYYDIVESYTEDSFSILILKS
jgi:inner membrane protein